MNKSLNTLIGTVVLAIGLTLIVDDFKLRMGVYLSIVAIIGLLKEW